MRIKRGLVFLFVILFLLNVSFISAIRISPARTTIGFQPGLEKQIGYFVSSGLDRYLEVYARGDLAEYINFSEDKIFREGSFTVNIKLPEKFDVPGLKTTFIGVRELVDKELLRKGGVGTAVTVESRISLFVPYPGKYVESHLKAYNVNINEPIEFQLEMIGRGDENVLAKPRIEIYSETGDLVDVLEFMERELSSQEKIALKKEWDTTGQSAGRYSAVSVIEYGGGSPSEDKQDFRIGELTLELVNYTKEVIIRGMVGYELVIGSGWNDKIDGAYAEVKLFNNTSPYGSITSFKTTPTDLEPWGERSILGYFNSSLFVPGTYEADVTLYYYGRDVGKTRRETINVKFSNKTEKKPNYIIWGAVILGLFLLIITILFLLFKDGKRKRK